MAKKHNPSHEVFRRVIYDRDQLRQFAAWVAGLGFRPEEGSLTLFKGQKLLRSDILLQGEVRAVYTHYGGIKTGRPPRFAADEIRKNLRQNRPEKVGPLEDIHVIPGRKEKKEKLLVVTSPEMLLERKLGKEMLLNYYAVAEAAELPGTVWRDNLRVTGVPLALSKDKTGGLAVNTIAEGLKEQPDMLPNLMLGAINRVRKLNI